MAQRIGHFALSAGHPGDLVGRITRHRKGKEGNPPKFFKYPLPPYHFVLPPSISAHSPPSSPHSNAFLLHTHIAMSFNKVDRVSTSSVTGPGHGRTNGSHLVQDQNEPRTNRYVSPFLPTRCKASRMTVLILPCLSSIFTGSKSGEHPQGRTSQAGGL